MPKSSAFQDWLPAPARAALRRLGEDLALARARRREALRGWAARIGVSVRTVQRMEAGDPGVGVGIYAAALWLVGRSDALATLADPAQDQGAQEVDVRAARRRLARRGVGAGGAAERATGRTTGRTSERTSGHETGHTTGRIAERATDRIPERAAEPALDRAAERARRRKDRE